MINVPPPEHYTDSSISIFSHHMKCTTSLRLGVFFIRLVFHAHKFPFFFYLLCLISTPNHFFAHNYRGSPESEEDSILNCFHPLKAIPCDCIPGNNHFPVFSSFFASPPTRRFIADLSLFIDDMICSLKSRGRWSGVKCLALSSLNF